MKSEKVSFLVLMAIFSFILILNSTCRHDTVLPPDTPVVCFERDVLPIFKDNCATAGCHDGGGGESSWALNNYSGISQGVTPGNPDGSSIYQSIIRRTGENIMPPSGPISIGNRTTIRIWILQGAQNTTCSLAKLLPKSP